MNGNRSQRQPTGSTIVYVLFILFVITLVATTVTTIMIRNNRITLGLSHSLYARYAPESGLERSLHYLQYARAIKTVGVESAVTTISSFGGNLNIGANYIVTATASDADYSIDIKQNFSEQWDIYGEDYPNGSSQPPVLDALTNLDNIGISWDEGSSCAAGNYVEVSFSSWTPAQWEDISNPDDVQTRYLLQCPSTDPSNPADCDYQLGVDDTHLYKVKVKPIDCSIENVTVQALDNTGAVIDTSNLVTIATTGEFSGSTRIINTTTTLWDPRLQHYFDFVVFSEQEITK